MTTLITLILTLIVFSYLLDDNPLFRLAISIFIGLAAAFTSIVTFQSVILPLTNSGGFNRGLLIISIFLTLLLFLKPIRSLRILTNVSLGFLIAVGAAISVVGAISGTLVPIVSQTAVVDTGNGVWGIVSSIILITGVVTSLLYFNYSARETADGEIARGSIMAIISRIGKGFIIITLAALYGAAILTSLTILTGQLEMLFGA